MNKEEHLIFRLPEDWTRSLNSESKIELGSIELDHEEPGRVFRVKFGQVETFAFLLDLPCIVETHKTLDDVNFFKNTDIAQMIYVIPEYEKDEPRAKSEV